MRNVIELMKLVSSLKDLQRTGWKQHGVSGIIDTTASHTLGVALLSWTYAKRENVDILKVLKMALVHDLVESVTGDLTPQDSKRVDREKLEKNGIQKVQERLPAELRDEVASLVEEFRREKTEESKMVKACDRLETVLQAHFYWKAGRLSDAGFRAFFEYGEKVCRTRFAKELLDQIRDAANLRR
jgi:putative hydrolase of HD superfamily